MSMSTFSALHSTTSTGDLFLDLALGVSQITMSVRGLLRPCMVRRSWPICWNV